MPIRRHSLLVPCRQLEDFPTHPSGDRAAELLAAWTALWHPALIAATGALPGWHPADEPPDPAQLNGELILIPSISRQRLAADWCDRLRATGPKNPPYVDAFSSRTETLAAALKAASIDSRELSPELVSDFLALGHAHLQVELLTRAMRYTSVLDIDQFTSATLAGASAVVAGDDHLAKEEIARAFDLLADARNHVYAVDFYVIDITLLAAATLGEGLRVKLAGGSPTSLLATGELLDKMACNHPATLAELRQAIEAGTACVVGGTFGEQEFRFAAPERVLADLRSGQEAFRRRLGRDCEVFAQFSASFSPLLPQILLGMGFRGALHATFDGGRLPRADQCKTWWGPRDGPTIEALAATPLDIARPETWLKLAERIGDTIAHDHVATLLLAGWPGTHCEYYEDLLRAARYGPVLGKLITLEEYFRVSRQPDEWTTFDPRESASQPAASSIPLSQRINSYRRDVIDTHRQLVIGLTTVIHAGSESANRESTVSALLNPWSFPCSRFIGVDPLAYSNSLPRDRADAEFALIADVPGCGYATRDAVGDWPSVTLAEGHILRNERLELTIGESTGGIQSLRAYRDRTTRISQRLVFQHGSHPAARDTQMVADEIEITQNDNLIGEITSRGRLLDPDGALLARFTQIARVVRGLPAVLVEVRLDPEHMPAGDVWKSYYASRLAWSDEDSSVCCGRQWTRRETSSQFIQSPEWLEINTSIGSITLFSLGLDAHRRIGPTRLDTVLLAAGEESQTFQFAVALDTPYATQSALAIITANAASAMSLPAKPNSSRGWFLHVGAKNIVATHIDPLPTPRSGIRLRVLETEGRDAHTTLAAFRPFRTAQVTDFRGNSTGVLSVVEGRVQFSIGAYRWIQIEAEFVG